MNSNTSLPKNPIYRNNGDFQKPVPPKRKKKYYYQKVFCEDIITNYQVSKQKILENYVKNKKNIKNKPLDAMFDFIMQVKPQVPVLWYYTRILTVLNILQIS